MRPARVEGRKRREQGALARFQYSDLKEDDGVSGGCGAMGIERTFLPNRQDTKELSISSKAEPRRLNGASPLEYSTHSVRRASGFVLVGFPENGRRLRLDAAKRIVSRSGLVQTPFGLGKV